MPVGGRTVLNNHPLTAVMVAAVLAPLLAEIPIGLRLPVAVLEVVLGIVIGPHVLHLIEPNSFLSFMTNVGTAVMLFMAGMEIDFRHIRGRPMSLAVRAWLASLGLALLAVLLLDLVPGVRVPTMIVIALTTTGLGTLLPGLRDGGMLEAPFGRLVLAAGAVGEVGPIVAASLALSERYSSWQEFAFLVVYLGIVGGTMALSAKVRPPAIVRLLARTLHASTQLPVRLALLLLAVLAAISEEFGFEAIFGSFAAGLVVGLAARGKPGESFRVKIDAVCFGWFTPFFFIGTGLAFDPGALFSGSTTMMLTPLLLTLFLLCRGVPVLLYRDVVEPAKRLPFALMASVPSIGLIVVISHVGLHTGHMTHDIAQALIAAALLASLLFPTLAGLLLSRIDAPGTEVERRR